LSFPFSHDHDKTEQSPSEKPGKLRLLYRNHQS
jgi:hypothetical protein